LVDGQEVARVKVAPDVEALHVIDLPQATAPGAHKVELRFEGSGQIAYQIVGRWFVPRQVAAPSSELEVTAHLDKSSTRPGDTIVEEVRVPPKSGALDMPIVTAGLPPGFDVDGDELQRLVREKIVDKVQQGPRELTLYLTRIDKPLSLKLRL